MGADQVTGATRPVDVHRVAALGGDDRCTDGADALRVDGDGGADDDTVTYTGTDGADTFDFVANGTLRAAISRRDRRRRDRRDRRAPAGQRRATRSPPSATSPRSRPAHLRRRQRQRHPARRQRRRHPARRRRQRPRRRQPGHRHRAARLRQRPFQWDPGDGNDTVEGQSGTDALDFNGSNIGELFELSRRTATACASPATSPTSSWTSTAIEPTIVHRASAAPTTVTVDDLAGTDMKTVNARPSTARTARSTALVVSGTEGRDAFDGDGRRRSCRASARARQHHRQRRRRLVTVARARRRRHDRHRHRHRPARRGVVDGGAGDRHDATYDGHRRRRPFAARGQRRRSDSVAARQRATTSAPSASSCAAAAARTRSAPSATSRALATLTLRRRHRRRHARSAATAPTCCSAAPATTSSTATRAPTPPCSAPATTVPVGPGRRQRHRRGPGRHRRARASTARAIGEILDVSANGDRVAVHPQHRQHRHGPRRRRARRRRALGGTDNVTVDDMTGTDLRSADVDLGAFTGGGDGRAGQVVVNGTERPRQREGSTASRRGRATGLRRRRGSRAASCSTTRCASTPSGRRRVTVDPDAELLITPVIDLGADG